MPRPRLTIAVILLTTTWGSAPAHGRPLALEDYYRLVTVQTPAMSPDGRWVAFIKTTIVEAENRRQNELWIVAADLTAAPRRLTDPSLNVSAPRWSPDGRLLTYSVGRRGAGASDAESNAIWFL